MKTIKLTRGFSALIDDEDYDLVSRFKWHCHESNSKLYAMTDLGTHRKSAFLYMHRLLVKGGKWLKVDHINGNGLDNRKSNIRVCTHQQNLFNRGAPKNNTSGFKGVTWSKKSKKWRAAITCNRKWKYLGSFDSKLEAASAYDNAALKLFREFAFLNFPNKE